MSWMLSALICVWPCYSSQAHTHTPNGIAIHIVSISRYTNTCTHTFETLCDWRVCVWKWELISYAEGKKAVWKKNQKFDMPLEEKTGRKKTATKTETSTECTRGRLPKIYKNQTRSLISGPSTVSFSQTVANTFTINVFFSFQVDAVNVWCDEDDNAVV